MYKKIKSYVPLLAAFVGIVGSCNVIPKKMDFPKEPNSGMVQQLSNSTNRRLQALKNIVRMGITNSISPVERTRLLASPVSFGTNALLNNKSAVFFMPTFQQYSASPNIAQLNFTVLVNEIVIKLLVLIGNEECKACDVRGFSTNNGESMASLMFTPLFEEDLQSGDESEEEMVPDSEEEEMVPDSEEE